MANTPISPWAEKRNLLVRMMKRATFYSVAILAGLLVPIAWMMGMKFISSFDIEWLIPILGVLALLFSGPSLVIYGLLTYFSDSPIQGKKVLAIIGFLSGVLWLSYLLKACVDGESV